MSGFGKLIRVMRTRQAMRQEDLAPRLGVVRQTLSKYETERLPVPPEVAVEAARCLGCSGMLGDYCRRCPVSRAQDRRQTKVA